MTDLIAVSTLDDALRLNAEHGWCPIPAEPESKAPLLRGMFDNPPGTPDAIRDAWSRAQWRIDRPDNPHWHGRQPNLLLHLGACLLLIVDTDLPEEVQQWESLCAAAGFDPGPPTVRTAGAVNADGSVKHHDGGHWYFDQPADLLLPGALNLRLTPAHRPDVFLQGGKRVAMAPPSFRNGKFYVPGGGPLRRPLPPFLRERIEASMAVNPVGNRTVVNHGTSPAEIDWATTTPILDLLPPGWQITGMDGECEVLAHPDASSSRSAVHHAAGCDHLPHSDVPLVVIFSTGVGDWMVPLVERGTPVTVSKLRLFAAQHLGNDLAAARRALGIGARAFRPSGSRAAHPSTTVIPAAPAGPVAPPAVSVAPAPAPPASGAAAATATRNTPAPAAALLARPAPVPPVTAPPADLPDPVAPTTTPAPVPVPVSAPRTAPTVWAVPRTLASPLFEDAVQALRSRALPPTDITEQHLSTLRNGRSWDREEALHWLYNTRPHLTVAEVADDWGIAAEAALPLLRLASLRLEGEVLVLERVGGPADLADHPGDPERGVPPWFDPLAYREAKSPERVRADRGALPEHAAFYCFLLDDGEPA